MNPIERLISDRDTFVDFCRGLADEPVIAIDTEFHSERRFWPELFLVQIADRSGPWAIDPLSVGDLAPLEPVLADPSITKVMHSARNDIAVLMRTLPGGILENVFDTQIAAAFLGYGEQCSLHNLLLDACGIKSKKAFCLSDWSRRPLAGEQLDYALDDVRYLLDLHARLDADLKRKKRTDWYRHEALDLVRPESYEVSLPDLFRRARSTGKIKKSNLPVLWRLIGWRETRARGLDRPRQHIAPDSLLARLAVMSPTCRDSLERLRGLPSGFAGKWGEEVLEVVRNALSDPPGDVPEIRVQRSDGAASARADILRIYAKQKAGRLGIATSLLMPRELLDRLASARPGEKPEDIVSGDPDLCGWRLEVLGGEVFDLLSGKLALALNPTRSGGLRFVRNG
ncbi:MAG TPA: HRDC domain-containing protein [Candidatus Fermentibacter daniensis]|nr:HRDC domain-containing protein [Candidatus Fermentibacter daniensis]HOR08047.1 HRDC domain-containing protein [Candidatus Fermentibacter daniensis]HPK51639.1 HRDC domain-containing protein [Candidatus Fermentibacter daniensis]